MNRLEPLIARRPRAFAHAAAMPSPRHAFERRAETARSSEELRLFATSFLSGLVFFGTYLA